MLFLMNLKNVNPKKDLCLAYSKGNMTVYPPTIELLAGYMSTQYPNKNSANQCEGKKRDRNRKKEDNPKSEDKYSNTACTAGAQVGNATPHEESATYSGHCF